mmetsp:Transcript_56493/g.183575  ORF Transcript_56493/g.183575 Transcript_56493/m.183575 type:complete len:221 (-) Transcript_56493:789-1451(-)
MAVTCSTSTRSTLSVRGETLEATTPRSAPNNSVSMASSVRASKSPECEAPHLRHPQVWPRMQSVDIATSASSANAPAAINARGRSATCWARLERESAVNSFFESAKRFQAACETSLTHFLAFCTACVALAAALSDDRSSGGRGVVNCFAITLPRFENLLAAGTAPALVKLGGGPGLGLSWCAREGRSFACPCPCPPPTSSTTCDNKKSVIKSLASMASDL